MTTRRQMVQWAITQLKQGLLASALPAKLMSEFGLSPARARDVAQAALRQRKNNGGKGPK